MNKIDQSKKEFLKSQFWYLTIAASFSRANIYLPNTNDTLKVNFKKKLFVVVDELIALNYTNAEVKQDKYFKLIESLQDFSLQFIILNCNELRIGVYQKY